MLSCIVCRMNKAALKTNSVIALNNNDNAEKKRFSLAGPPWILLDGVQDQTESGVPCCWLDQGFHCSEQNDVCPWVSCISAPSCRCCLCRSSSPLLTLRRDRTQPECQSLWRPMLPASSQPRDHVRPVIIIIIIIAALWQSRTRVSRTLLPSYEPRFSVKDI